ncbi:MAG: putative metal-binding motif-containing protein [Pseudomonadota bacterium]
MRMEVATRSFRFGLGCALLALLISCAGKTDNPSPPPKLTTATSTPDPNEGLCNGGLAWYQDTDEDGYGVPDVYNCNPKPGFVLGTEMDCNENDPTIHPKAIELLGDGIDNNCDGTIDEATGADPTLIGNWADYPTKGFIGVSSEVDLDAATAFHSVDPIFNVITKQQLHMWIPWSATSNEPALFWTPVCSHGVSCNYVKATKLVPGKGYAVSTSGNGIFRQLQGSARTTPVVVTVTGNAINAISNPFNQTINLVDAIKKGDGTGTIDDVVWKDTDGTYYIYGLNNQPLTTAKKFQGFWLGVPKDVTSITINPPTAPAL